MQTGICPRCGLQNPEDAVFCMTCGTTLPQTAAQAVQPTAPQGVAPTVQTVYAYQEKPKTSGRGLRIAAMVLGIFAVIIGFSVMIVALNPDTRVSIENGQLKVLTSQDVMTVSIVAAVCSALSIGFGVGSLSQGNKGGMPISGIVMGIVGMVGAAVALLAEFVF